MDEYRHLLVTQEFLASLDALDPPVDVDDLTGIVHALDDLDAEPTNFRNRLHRLDRELADWWSLTPPPPAHRGLRILVRPERAASGGLWRIGPATWHYAR